MADGRVQQRALAVELGGEPLPGLDTLSERDAAALSSAIRDARRRQQDQLSRALDAALGHLPALLRGPVRKILMP